MRTRRTAVAATFVALVVASCGAGDAEVLTLSGSWASTEAGANRTADSKIGSWAPVEYRVAAGLEKPAGRAHAWRALEDESVNERLRAVARALDISGDLVETSDGGLATATIGDPTTGSVWMSVSGGVASWSYASSAMTSAVSEPCAPDQDECGGRAATPTTFPETTRPVLPTDGEAETKARRILGSSGYDLASLSLSVTRGEWSVAVGFEELVDGVAAWSGGIDIGDGGAVVSAWGHFARQERAGSYPLVDLDVAVTQLGSVSTMSPAAQRNVATDDGDATVSESPTGESVPASTLAPVVVEITEVSLVLQPATTTDGVTYLLPSYRFSNDDGMIGVAYAIAPEFLRFDGGSTEPAPGTAVPPPAPEPDEMTPIPQGEADTLVGLAEDEATKVATDRGWMVRIAERDGERFMLTMDFAPSRVNLSITRGVVTAVTVG